MVWAIVKQRYARGVKVQIQNFISCKFMQATWANILQPKTNISAAKKPSQLAFSQADINLNTNFDQKSFNQTFKVNLNIITHTFRIQTNSNIEEN